LKGVTLSKVMVPESVLVAPLETTSVTATACGELEAPAEATAMLAVYVPAGSEATLGWTVMVKGALVPVTGAASQPDPEA
jgi:uncharacterized membrane protein